MQDHAIPSETWRPIPGWEDLYSVSDAGRVMSHRRGIILAQASEYHTGYRSVCLASGPKRVNIRIHRAVLLAFVGPLPSGKVTRHVNGDPRDNRLANLQYGTYSENSEDMAHHGSRLRGEGIRNSKLKAQHVIEIRALVASGQPRTAIAQRFSVSRSTIDDIIRGKRWRHL